MGLVATAGRAVAWVVAGGIVLLPLTAPGGLLGGGAALAEGALTVTGDVAGLTPGARAPLELLVRNGGDADVVVSEIQVRVSGGSGECAPSALTVEQYAGRLDVPAGGSASTTVGVTVRPGVDCADVGWTLHYTAVTA